jgi:hypothetical protein
VVVVLIHGFGETSRVWKHSLSGETSPTGLCPYARTNLDHDYRGASERPKPMKNTISVGVSARRSCLVAVNVIDDPNNIPFLRVLAEEEQR